MDTLGAVQFKTSSGRTTKRYGKTMTGGNNVFRAPSGSMIVGMQMNWNENTKICTVPIKSIMTSPVQNTAGGDDCTWNASTWFASEFVLSSAHTHYDVCTSARL